MIEEDAIPSSDGALESKLSIEYFVLSSKTAFVAVHEYKNPVRKRLGEPYQNEESKF
jgi:hypothetical protein